MKNLRSILTGLLLTFSFQMYAQPHTIDKTFSNDGYQTTLFKKWWDIIYATTIQSNGKIVAVGVSDDSTYDKVAIARYNADGTLDNTFSGDGKLITKVGAWHDEANAVAIQSDGKILVAGHTHKTFANRDILVLRYNSDGTLDNNFSTDGMVIIPIGSETLSSANSIIVQSNGKILVGGSAGSNTCIVRLNADGSLDNTFSSDGIVSVLVGGINSNGNGMALQGDGKIVIGGTCNISVTDREFFAARFNSDGTFDNTFSADGKVITSISTDYEEAYALALAPDGKIVLAGDDEDGIVLVRFNTDGTLDNSFSSDGIVKRKFSGVSTARSVVVQPDSKIIIAGTGYDNNEFDYEFLVMRFSSSGVEDFLVFQDFVAGHNDDQAYSVALQSDGKIVVGGYINDEFGVARFMGGKSTGILNFSASDNSFLIYPNPVQKNTVFDYTLQNEEQITIELQDMNGRLLKTYISNEKQAAGKHEQAIVLPDNLSSGNYIISISSPTGQLNIKIVK